MRRTDREVTDPAAIDAIIQQGNIIVFIDEMHTLAQAGGKEGEVTPADMLKPYLARGELQTIGATTTDEYRKFIEKDKALERRFQPIIVNPPTVEQTIEILKGIRPNYEAFHKIKISDEAIVAAANLSDRYISDRFLPDKAIDLIDEAASRAKVNSNKLPPDVKDLEDKIAQYQNNIEIAKRNEDYIKADEYKVLRDETDKEIQRRKSEWKSSANNSIGAEEIAEVVSKWTKIPVTRLSETETERLNNLEKILHERVVGQDAAVESVAKAIRRARAGLKDPKRPIGTFLFLGPTGVGKTELAKALAEALFDDEHSIVRLDMSEYMEKYSVSRLIGAPPGYVGYEEGGQLTEAVRRKPYSVVLFDEVEKAHPDVFNVLLQVLDDGRITDGQGRTVDFRNTIIILTSNLGSQYILDGINEQGEISEEARKSVDMLLKQSFRPEFLNRLDEIIMFKPLTKDNISNIINLLVADVNKRLADKELEIVLTDAAKDFIVENGFDPMYGARPLKRYVQKSVETLAAKLILAGDVSTGDKILIDCENGTLVAKDMKS